MLASPLSTRLKTGTRALHDEAEAHAAMRALVSETLTPAAYRAHLAALLRFHAALEPALAACPGLGEWVGDLEARRKTPALRADLLRLGMDEAEVDQAMEAPGSVPLQMTGPADGLGVLYVTEGATLGGRILARHLADSLGVDADTGAAHFLSYGDDRGAMWKRYREAVDAFGEANPDQAGRVVEAAKATFAAFSRALPTP